MTGPGASPSGSPPYKNDPSSLAAGVGSTIIPSSARATIAVLMKLPKTSTKTMNSLMLFRHEVLNLIESSPEHYFDQDNDYSVFTIKKRSPATINFYPTKTGIGDTHDEKKQKTGFKCRFRYWLPDFRPLNVG
jgi:hypothetical protein